MCAVRAPCVCAGHLLDALSVACDYFHFVDAGELMHFPKFDVVEHQRPHIVAEAVCVQFGRFESDAGFDLCVQRRVD